jgi:hypothetical protein
LPRPEFAHVESVRFQKGRDLWKHRLIRLLAGNGNRHEKQRLLLGRAIEVRGSHTLFAPPYGHMKTILCFSPSASIGNAIAAQARAPNRSPKSSRPDARSSKAEGNATPRTTSEGRLRPPGIRG